MKGKAKYKKDQKVRIKSFSELCGNNAHPGEWGVQFCYTNLVFPYEFLKFCGTKAVVRGSNRSPVDNMYLLKNETGPLEMWFSESWIEAID